jgi:hypothetical protein
MHLKNLRDVCPNNPNLSLAPILRLPQQSDSLSDDLLLRYYVERWDRYVTGAKHIHRLFMYFNRHWVKGERQGGRNSIYPVFTVSIASYSTTSLTSLRSGSSRSYSGRQISSLMSRAGLRNWLVLYSVSSSSNETAKRSIKAQSRRSLSRLSPSVLTRIIQRKCALMCTRRCSRTPL